MTEIANQLKEFASRLVMPLAEHQLELLCRNVSVISYHPHEIITKQGAFVSHCIWVKRGLLKLYIEGTSEKTILVEINGCGDLVGLPDLFSTGNSSFNVASLSEAEVFLIRTDTLQHLIKECPGLSYILMEELSRIQSILYSRLFSLGTKQMHGRLADVIIYLTNPKYSRTDIFNCITRKDIADLCGMSTESVVRLLKEFKDDGLIFYEGKDIRIKNLELLERLSRIG